MGEGRWDRVGGAGGQRRGGTGRRRAARGEAISCKEAPGLPELPLATAGRPRSPDPGLEAPQQTALGLHPCSPQAESFCQRVLSFSRSYCRPYNSLRKF